MPDSENEEVIIAQEQDAVYRAANKSKIEGTLILTNKRLIFASGDERRIRFTSDLGGESRERQVEDEVTNVMSDLTGIGGILFYSEIEDLNKIAPNPMNLFIPLSGITLVEGEKERLLEKPRLKISWRNDASEVVQSEFQENLTGPSRKKNLNDWAAVIEQLKSGNLEIQKLPAMPSQDTLEGKIAYMMGDMQEKGSAEIEQQVEQAFKVDLDLDQVEEACEKLVSMGLLVKVPDSAESFYRKRSPVGIYELSS